MRPFSALLKSLKALFELEANRKGRYVFRPIQDLKKAIESYNQDNNHGYSKLLEAIVASKPFVEKWRLNFEDIKHCMDKLAQNNLMPTIHWESLLNDKKNIHRFDFNSDSFQELIPWLESKMDKSYSNQFFLELNSESQTKLLIENVESIGFSEKFKAYLEKEPDFLVGLTLSSVKNFIAISGSRLNLYLTDQQLAMAIIKHAPKMLIEHTNEFIQIEIFINKLNEILSNGRSVATLLRNEEAKTVLEDVKLFQQYQSEDYKNRHDESLIPDSKLSIS